MIRQFHVYLSNTSFEKQDKHKALYRLCNLGIHITVMGKSALTSHSKGNKYQANRENLIQFLVCLSKGTLQRYHPTKTPPMIRLI